MKKRTFIIILACLLNSFGIMAQSISDTMFAKHVIRTYPLNYVAGGEINLGYEQVINRNSSYEIILAWNFRDWVFIPSGAERNAGGSSSGMLDPFAYNGVPSLKPSVGGSIRLNYRHYFTKNKPMPLGAYISPQFMFKHTNFNELYVIDEFCSDSIKISKNAITLKVLLGYQSKVFNRLSINYYFGAGFRYQSQKVIRYYRKSWYHDNNVYVEDTDNVINRIEIFAPTLHLGISIGYFF